MAQRLRDQYGRNGEDLNWKVIGFGKFSGSKETNILWQHQVFGEVYIWHLEGGTYLGERRVQAAGNNLK